MKLTLAQTFQFMLKEQDWQDRFIYEHKFHPSRRWKFDAADIEAKCAVEFEGGVWIKGRHTSGSGYIKDCEKYNEAQMLGWIVLRYADAAGLAQFPFDYIRAAKLHGFIV